MSEPVVIYLLDTYSYDARGGTSEPFATLEGAMAATRPDIEWVRIEDRNGDVEWAEKMSNDYSDQWVIQRRTLGP